MSELVYKQKPSQRTFTKPTRLVSNLRLNKVKINCCLNKCMFYYKDDATLTHCKFCGEPRFKRKKRESVVFKDVPYKRMHYLSLITRLQRLYALISSAPFIRWH